MNRILVCGATGLLGVPLVAKFKSLGYDIFTSARSGGVDFKFNLINYDESSKFLNEIYPNVIINLVGLTSVESCEMNPNLAYLTNTRSVENLVKWINSKNADCHLIQISTDHVYDAHSPSKEDSVVLRNYYAYSKYSADMIALSTKNHTILRTNFFGKSQTPGRESITDWVFDAVTNNKKVKVFNDVFFNPLSLNTLIGIIDIVAVRKIFGLFNLGSHNGMSKADFDFYFAKCLGFTGESMESTQLDKADYLKATRPKNMVMNCDLFEKVSGIRLPLLRDEIEIEAKVNYK